MSVVRIAYPQDGSFPKERAGHVTMSRFGALVGCDPWATPGQVYAEKLGVDFGDRNTVPMQRGKLLEPVVAAMLAKERPDLKIWKANEYIFDPVLRCGASPDYYATDRDGRKGDIEIKTTSKRRFDRLWSDGPPVHYALQIAGTMWLDDADFGLLVALIFDEFTFEIRVFDVPRHIGAEHRIRETVEKFWRDFDAGIPPKIDYERDGALIALMYPADIEGKVVDLRGDNRMPELLAEHERLTAAIKEAETAKTVVANEIKMKIGDAESALVNGWRVTLKLQTRKAHQVKESSFRVLKPTREAKAA